jgi:rhomboid protease GluP
LVSKQGRNLALAIMGGLLFGMLTSCVSIDHVQLILVFLQSNSVVFAGGYWQLLTSILVAPPVLAGVEDVLFNALAVLWLDRLLSGAYNPTGYYTTFVLTGLAGNLFSLLNGPTVSSFGASGGIFGLLAGAVSEDYAAERRINFGLLLWFLLIFIISSFLLSDVDWLAHLGGALSGLLVGYYLGVKQREVQL